MRSIKSIQKKGESKLSIFWKKIYYFLHPEIRPEGVSRIEYAYFFGYDDK